MKVREDWVDVRVNVNSRVIESISNLMSCGVCCILRVIIFGIKFVVYDVCFLKR